jgi:hypothetical protein
MLQNSTYEMDTYPKLDLIYDDTIDTSVIQNILLISSNVAESQLFYDSANSNTFPIIYSPCLKKIKLITLLRNKFQTGITRIAFAFHNTENIILLDNQAYFEESDLIDNQLTFSENVTFIINLITEFNIIHCDFLQCASLQYSNWKKYYELLNKHTNVICGASNDNTGNIQYGANWLMENTNEMVKDIYFNSHIDNYASYLAVFTVGNLTYSTTGSNATITGFSNVVTNSVLTIPSTVTSGGTTYNVTKIGSRAFQGCTFSSVIIPTSISITTSDGTNNAIFAVCPNLTTINIPSSITVITQDMFDQCRALTSVTLPNTLTKIDYFGFQSCSALQSITIPASVTVIMDYAFRFATVLTSVTFNGNIPTIGVSNFENSNDTAYYISGALNTSRLSSFTNSQVIKASPTIGTLTIPSKIFGEVPFLITNPSSNSTGSFNYVSSNLSVATISGNTITIIGVGSATITATQAETASYSSGTKTALFTVTRASPTIATLSIPSKTFGEVPFLITNPSSNSDGSFNYISSDSSVATISGNTITIIGIGNTTITATQSATTNYFSGTTSTLFSVTKATPTIATLFIPSKIYGDGPFLITDPSSNSSGSFSYVSSDLSVATIFGNTITIIGIGDTTITATQTETTNYFLGTTFTLFTVAKPTPIIEPLSIPSKIYGEEPFQINNPSSNSDGSFNYISSNSSVATISGNTITIVGVGQTTITATQTETADYSSGTTIVLFTVTKITPTIATLSIPSKTFGEEPFQVDDPLSNSDGSFNYVSSNLSVATISGNTVTIVGAGNTTITASQTETANYFSRTTSSLFTVTKASPTIAALSIPPKIYGEESFQVEDPSSNSTGSFNYVSSNLLVATISGNTITIVGAGNTTITATQSTTTNYSSGTTSTQFSVAKASPTIAPLSIPLKVYGEESFQVDNPLSNSDGSFNYDISDPLVATISGNTITIVGVGSATITATQSGTANYFSGTTSTQFTVTKSSPTIAALSIPLKVYGEESFQINNPLSNSDGSFNYVSLDSSVATISGNTITIVGAGSATIQATQSETMNYSSKTISTLFSVTKASPTIATLSIPSKTFGEVPFLITNPSSNSDGSFNYVSSDPSVATISGNTITIVGAGSTTITADQLETTNYSYGTTSILFSVTKASPTISGVLGAEVWSIPLKIYGEEPFQINNPTSNSDGSFNYVSSNLLVATISGDTVTIVGAGSTTITATQLATTNYLSGTTFTVFSVTKASPTIAPLSIPLKVYGEESFQVDNPLSNSDGSFNYDISDPLVATISGNTITIVGVGNTTITATQLETTNYSSKTTSTVFTVTKASPTIETWFIPSKIYGEEPFQMNNPTSNSDGSFNYVSSNLSVATISGNTITIVGVGNTTITATQSATTNYSAGTTSTLFSVTNSSPTIETWFIPSKIYGEEPFQINSPISNSDGSFNYVSSNLSVATISGNTITIVGVGNTTITATQSATTNYFSGTTSTLFSVTRASPTIAALSIPSKVYGEASFQINNPVSNSDGSFNYVSSNLSVATIFGNTITIIGAGSATITATQSETTNYSSGTRSTLFTVTKIPPIITSLSIPLNIYSDTPFIIIDPSSNSDGSFNYVSSNLSVATISGNTMRIVGIGSATITATQSETMNYTSETTSIICMVTKSLQVLVLKIPPLEQFNEQPLNIILKE